MTAPLPATRADVRGIWSLRRQREDWLIARGIDQWRPGEVPVSVIREQVDRGEWYVLREEEHHVIAGLRLLWQDPDFWGPDDGTAIYVHGLMLDLALAGEGLGAQLLGWAAAQGALQGKTRLRLDSAATNPRLATYYEDSGFSRQGQRQVGDFFEVILWERPIATTG
ncbi:GNAT family N-acetyltransferase [Nesterenkonia flava]|uniref:GNAT family N-acetyltransferase n=1 Tax=Nesterenkonia flava TaxID=469799 RepID=A0ABU1FTK4_9MICC|nr:GNAT family N-acetyltransferase [Nesterenkonia flava]MDR5711513.1 GNAT family N-acetyltransferase [Nesterenkonia flava]